MFSINDKISNRQLQALLILDVFGTGVTLLPRVTAEYAGQSGWISVLLGTLLALACICLMTSVASKFPQMTFVEYTSAILSKPVGIILSALFVIKIGISTALELRFFGEIVRHVLLNNTPFALICASMLVIGGYAAAKGYETRARLAELLIFAMFLPLVFVFGIAATQVDYTNLLPMKEIPLSQVLRGGGRALFSFTGFEFVLLAYPYINKPKETKKSVLGAALFTGLFMCLITIITLARFGPVNVQMQIWPVLEMMDTINLPGSFIERQGAFIMSFWIVSIFSIVNAGLFFSSLLLRDIVKKGPHLLYIIIMIVLIFIGAFIPDNLAQTFSTLHWLYRTLGIGFFLIVPLVLLLVSKLRRAKS